MDQTQHHADARRGETVMPIDFLAQRAANQRANERAQVDAHVKDREPRVAARAAFGIQFADHGADVRLQQSRAQHDQQQTEVERPGARNGQGEMADRDEDSAIPHRSLGAEQPIRDPSSR